MISLPTVYDFRHCWSNTVCYASFEKMRISGNPKKKERTVCQAVMEGLSPGWKMSF
jgi:hypothetical protein